MRCFPFQLPRRLRSQLRCAAPHYPRSSSPERPAARDHHDAGMTTAEYAVGTVAACGFAGLLFKILTSSQVQTMVTDIVERALQLPF